MNPSVHVMLSTYNGSLYLREQIESILAQQQVKVTLTVRDDGSADDTMDILASFAERLHVTKGSNLGAAGSFMQMIYENKETADYYAFADQDDVWLPEKLKTACEVLSKYEEPALYCSNQMLTDAKGTELGMRYSGQLDTSWIQIVCGNPFAGCTMVWNRELQQLLMQQDRSPSAGLLKKRMHDVWVAAVAALTGKIVYDERSYILYRQHENNVVGAKRANKIKLWKKKMHDPELRNGRSDLCRGLRDAFYDRIDGDDVRLQIETIADYRTDAACRKRLWNMTQIAKKSGESVLSYRLKILLKLV